MKKFKRKVTLICTFTRLVFILTFMPHSAHFCLDHTENVQCTKNHNKLPWPELCYTGRHQSPINLPKLNFHGKPGVINVDRSSYGRKNFLIYNNGFTIVLTDKTDKHTNDTTSTTILKDKKKYVFSQAHFHWGENNSVGSEHTIGGKQFTLEMHLVHYSNRYSTIVEAVNNVTDRLALSVIGILFEAADDHPDSLVMKTINDVIPLSVHTDHKHFQFDLRDVLPKRGADFYRYAGSLTTPPCAEIVQWIVFAQPIKISTLDMKYFRKVTDPDEDNLKSNFRSIQPGNLRLIEFLKLE